MSKQPILYLIHIIECIERIEIYIDELQGKHLLSDRKTYDAILRNLQVMAESSQRLPLEIKNKQPDIEWDNMAGFRNVLMHDYLGDIDEEIVMNVIKDKLPELKLAVLQWLPNWQELKKKK
jgi:uncharacterized protein with HEPN domain